MHAPEPKEFGVDRQDIEWVEKIDRRLPGDAFVASAIAWVIYVSRMLINAKTFDTEVFHLELGTLFALALTLVLYVFVGLMVVFVTAIIVGVPGGMLLQLLVPRYRRATIPEGRGEVSYLVVDRKSFGYRCRQRSSRRNLLASFGKRGFGPN